MTDKGEEGRDTQTANCRNQSSWRPGAAAAYILIGAGLACLIMFGVRAFRRPPVEQPQPIAQESEPIQPVEPPQAVAPAPEPPPPPEPSALEKAFLATKTPTEAFKVLQDAFDAAKAGETGHADDYSVIIALCAQIKEKWPITNEAANSMKLASQCWTELGETQEAQDAFVGYADYTGELEERQELRRGKTPEQAKAVATDIASRMILGEAETLFARKDYVQSLGYCDLLVARYPTEERGLNALKLVGDYSVQHKQYGEAIRTFNQVIELNPDSRAATLARMSLPHALANSGQNEKAHEVWLECARRAEDDRERANYTYLAAGMLARAGKERVPDAVALYEKVIEDYPDQTTWVNMARRSLANLRMKPFKTELKSGQDPLDLVTEEP